MRSLAATAAISGIVLIVAGRSMAPRIGRSGEVHPSQGAAVQGIATGSHAPSLSDDQLTGVVKQYCVTCHNDRRLRGNLSLEDLDVAQAPEKAPTVEKMIVKLRAGMMPPPGARRPSPDTLLALVQTLEDNVDKAAASDVNPGHRVYQRLNRAEYEQSVEDLLGLQVDAGKWLPPDTKSANFDNIADVQMPSATLIDAFVNAAADISRLAVGYPNIAPSSTMYDVPRMASQRERIKGAPEGTRGGIVVTHNFPADGEYVFTMQFQATPTGELYGMTAPFDEQMEVSIDGERVALLPIDRWMTDADQNNLTIQTDSIQVTAGPHVVAAAFMKQFEGPVNDDLAPIGHSIADTNIGMERGITNNTHLRNMAVKGPYEATGVSDSPSRERIFTCRPLSAAEEHGCAEKIISRLATQAYRGPVSQDEVADLLKFYDQGAQDGGFENGVRVALEAILSSPHFLFRFEELPAGAKPGKAYPIADVDLASRLSFFLWGAPPDQELLSVAEKGKLQDDDVLREQTLRMLKDPRSEALATRFAAQWLRLSDLDKINPDALEHPEYDLQLATDMKKETELFFYDLVREDRSVLDLYNANYTFLNERLADHYGIEGVVGEQFRKVTYPDDRRAGLLGQGSILTLTSHANRTSPVLRGKWVMEVLMGTPPPPPPPGVPALDETASAKGTTPLTTRERMEMHRAAPMCASCHSLIDPIGLALDNFDVTGQWRIRENGVDLDTRGTFYDGTPINSPADLRQALLKRPIPLIRTFTQNLMAYALGRRVEYYDQPLVRKITKAAAANDNRMSSFILGVVESDAFRMQKVATVASTSDSKN